MHIGWPNKLSKFNQGFGKCYFRQHSEAANESQGKLKTGQLMFAKNANLDLDYVYLFNVQESVSLNDLGKMTGKNKLLLAQMFVMFQSAHISHEWAEGR